MGTTEPTTLTYYSMPGMMTSAGASASRFDDLPADPVELARIAQGLIVHEHLAGAYGRTLTDEERATVHVRRVERLIERIVAIDARPLAVARPVEHRVAGNCRHFTVLLVAMLRAHGVPARARCGFGRYFVDGRHEDHWVAERWDAERGWTLIDAQLDEAQQRSFGLDFDPDDVPRDRFLTGGDAWRRCRSGDADPDTFGLSVVDEAGWWWIAGNLMRDAAALGNLELLPWDCWGAMPGPADEITDDLVALFDELAELTRDPDASFVELGCLRDGDDRLRVPATVLNALLAREERL
jgi:hypothetical protein